MKITRIICILIIFISLMLQINCGSSKNSAFSDEPIIEPKVNFIYPPDKNNLDENKFDDFPPNGKIIMVCNKAIDFSTVSIDGNNSNSFVIMHKLCGTQVTGFYAQDNENPNIITFKPFFDSENPSTSAILPDEDYTIILRGIKDTDGEQIEDSEYSFHSAKEIDTTKPVPKIVEKYSKELQLIMIKSESDTEKHILIDDSLIDEEKILIKMAGVINDPGIPCEVFYNTETQRLIVKPNTSLEDSIQYQLEIKPDAMKSISGNNLAGPDPIVLTFYLIPEPNEKHTIDIYNTSSLTYTTSTALKNGNFVVCFQEYISSSESINKFSIYNAVGAQIGTTQTIDSGDLSFHFESITLSNGNFVVFYAKDNGSEEIGQFHIYDSSGNKVTTDPIEFYEFARGYAYNIKATPLSNGNFIICFYNQGVLLYLQLYNQDGLKIDETDFNNSSRYLDIKTLLNNNIICTYYTRYWDDIEQEYKYRGEFRVFNSDLEYVIGDIYEGQVIANNEDIIPNEIVVLSNGDFVITFSDPLPLTVRKGYFEIYSPDGVLKKQGTVFSDGSFTDCIALNNGNFMVAYKDSNDNYLYKYEIFDENGDSVTGIYDFLYGNISSVVFFNYDYFSIIYNNYIDEKVQAKLFRF